MNTIIGVRQVPPSRPRSNQSKNMRQKPMHMITCVCYNKYSNHNEQQKKEEPHDVWIESKRACDCNEHNIRGTILVYFVYLMTQMVKYSCISKEWILLNTRSTMPVFNNKQFLTNIQEIKETLCAISNAGMKIHTRLENFQIWGLCWITLLNQIFLYIFWMDQIWNSKNKKALSTYSSQIVIHLLTYTPTVN